MEQITEQGGDQKRRGNPNWVPGVSANPRGRLTAAAKQERIERKAAELAAEFGGLGALSACEKVMLEQAAALLLRRPRSSEDVVRVANAIGRILGSLTKHRKPIEQGTDLRAYLAEAAARHADEAVP
jgi:hypothetical protein